MRNPPSSSSPSNRQNGSKRDSGSSRGIASAGTNQPGLGSEGQDIPVARRSQLIKPQRRFRFRQSLLTATLLLAGTASLILLFRDPIQRQLAPPPVRGLNVRQGLGGRLEYLGVVRQAEVVVRAEHDPLLAVDDHDGVFGLGDRLEVRVEPRGLGC